MCQFLSWIKKDGKIFFLTDKDILSSYGKKILKGCKDNDKIGHGAIRKYFNFDGGEERECTKFWGKKNFPTEIQKCLKNFDENFNFIFENFLDNDDLRYIIYNAPEKIVERAWKKLESIASKEYLWDIICYAPEKFKEKAWKKLEPVATKNDLQCVVCYAPEKIAEKAWKKLEPVVDNDDLWFIICYASEKWKNQAKIKLNNKKNELT